ncbi:MAG: universal stress protein [Nitrospira sp.]|nr:MAG: universal stress protein [Nitrospira sp.]
MRIVIAVDWSDQAFNAVQEATRLFAPTEVTLVHAVNLGFLEHPVVAQAMNLQGYDEFRRAMKESGEQLLDRTAALIPAQVSQVRRLCECGSPATIVIEAARAASADLIVMGPRGRGRVSEALLGSVSHRVLLHSSCSMLLVKRPMESPRRMLVAVQHRDDAARIVRWLAAHPFTTPVEFTLLHVVLPLRVPGGIAVPQLEQWHRTALQAGHDLVQETAEKLTTTGHAVTTQVLTGDPPDLVAGEAEKHDLLIVGSHSRTGVERVLLGSVSHTLTHFTPNPILIIRA